MLPLLYLPIYASAMRFPFGFSARVTNFISKVHEARLRLQCALGLARLPEDSRARLQSGRLEKVPFASVLHGPGV